MGWRSGFRCRVGAERLGATNQGMIGATKGTAIGATTGRTTGATTRRAIGATTPTTTRTAMGAVLVTLLTVSSWAWAKGADGEGKSTNGGSSAQTGARGGSAVVDEAAPLEGLSRLAGEWRAKGDWDDPSKGSMSVVYEFSVNRRAMTGQSFRTAESTEHKVYETLIGWHPGRKEIVWYSFSSWGAFYDGTMVVSGDVVEMVWTDYTAGRVAQWRETLTLEGDSAFNWKVWNKKGEEWVLAKEGQFEKVGARGDGSNSGAGSTRKEEKGS